MLDHLLRPEIQELIAGKKFLELKNILVDWYPQEIAELIENLPKSDDVIIFRSLPLDLATSTFEYLSSEKQQRLVEDIASEKERLAGLLEELSPDDRTAFLEELPGPVGQKLLSLLSPDERKMALTLLGYPEDSIGRLMTPEYIRARPEWTIEKTLGHIRKYGKDSETLNVIYVVDEKGHLIDDLRIREILLAPPEMQIKEIMDGRFISLKATDDQEGAVSVFRDYDRIALPVTDTNGILIGIVTIDDILDVAEEEVTEDIHKMGGSEALEAPYMEVSLWTLVHKRARWLTVLFLGEMLTASAMGYFEHEIARALVLTLFIPLIISSGGNSGSQAATLIIRAMAIGEVRLMDWWKVMRRELLSGFALGSILGLIGIFRVLIWQQFFDAFGPHYFLIGLTVGFSLLGVVMLGTLAGSMLPFLMRRIGVDPATSSAPFVATLVDVAGLVIYFSVAAIILSGTIL